MTTSVSVAVVNVESLVWLLGVCSLIDGISDVTVIKLVMFSVAVRMSGKFISVGSGLLVGGSVGSGLCGEYLVSSSEPAIKLEIVVVNTVDGEGV